MTSMEEGALHWSVVCDILQQPVTSWVSRCSLAVGCNLMQDCAPIGPRAVTSRQTGSSLTASAGARVAPPGGRER